MAAAVVSAGTSSFESARYRTGTLCHARIQVTLCRDWAGGPGLPHPRLRWAAARFPKDPGRAGLQRTLAAFAGSVGLGGLGGIQQELRERNR